MATLTFEFDDQTLAIIVNDVCKTYGYQEEVSDPADRRGPKIANPQTKAEFARAHVIGHLNEISRARRTIEATEAAQAQVQVVTLQELAQ